MKRVLFVDDQPNIRRAMKRLLVDQGYHVTLADDGLTALEAAVNGVPFDVLITDLNMAVMPGDELIRRLRQQGFAQPMLVYTAAPAAVTDCGQTAVYDKTRHRQLLADLPGLIQ